MFESVIFDWDGTLADTKEAILASFHGALREVVHFDVSDEFIERRIGIGAAWTFREILQSKGQSFDEQLVGRLVAAKIRVALENTDKVNLFPDALDLLESLRGKVKLGLASMNNRQIIEHLLNVLDLGKFFNVVVTVNEVSKSKPDPEIFLRTAQTLESTPSACVVVEDSLFGVQAAKAANMTCVAVAQGAYSVAELSAAGSDLVLDSLQNTAPILRLILK
ncbi:MAG: HAD family hydrolase [Candidatus Bathyarchaeia archaeon]|jgi:HAD superfamily hydrolase (TIGR01509 family)